jgi:hypothetical protein
MRDNMQAADLGSLQPEIDLAQWMDADLSVEMLDPIEEDDLPPAGSPTTIWVYSPHRVDA